MDEHETKFHATSPTRDEMYLNVFGPAAMRVAVRLLRDLAVSRPDQQWSMTVRTDIEENRINARVGMTAKSGQRYEHEVVVRPSGFTTDEAIFSALLGLQADLMVDKQFEVAKEILDATLITPERFEDEFRMVSS